MKYMTPFILAMSLFGCLTDFPDAPPELPPDEQSIKCTYQNTPDGPVLGCTIRCSRILAVIDGNGIGTASEVDSGKFVTIFDQVFETDATMTVRCGGDPS